MNELQMQNPIVPLEEDSVFFASQSSPILLGLGVLLLVLMNHAVFIEVVTSLHNRCTVPFLEKNKLLLSRGALYLSIALLVCSHLVEISIWGMALFLAGLVPSFTEAAFFSGSTYTTLGYGKDLLPGSWDTITVIIALSGMFSIAWTTSSLISMIAVFHPTRIHTPKPRVHPADEAPKQPR
jgi:hypothetical protein